MPTPSEAPPRPPLTPLAEDETLLRDTVRDFAESRSRPLVREMDEHARFPALADRPALRPRRHGHRDPGSARRRRRTFFHAVLVVEELSRVDPSVGVLVDVQNTLVDQCAAAAGASPDLQARVLPGLAADRGRRLRAVGSRLGQRRLRADDARPGGRRPLRHRRPQALDHQRQRGRHLHRLCDGQSRCRLSRHHGVRRRSRHGRASPSARRKTSSASARRARAS